MTLTISCPTCGTKAQVPHNAAGMRGKCGACGAVVHVPKRGKENNNALICPRCGSHDLKFIKPGTNQCKCRSCGDVSEAVPLPPQATEHAVASPPPMPTVAAGATTPAAAHITVGPTATHDAWLPPVMPQTPATSDAVPSAGNGLDEGQTQNAQIPTAMTGQSAASALPPPTVTTPAEVSDEDVNRLLHASEPAAGWQTKPCPFCAKWVDAVATKCRFCGKTLAKDHSIPARQQTHGKADTHNPSPGDQVPAYAALRIAVTIFEVLAGLEIMAALIMLIIGAVANHRLLALAGLGLLACAFIFWAMSQLISAFRDIARNSWIMAFRDRKPGHIF